MTPLQTEAEIKHMKKHITTRISIISLMAFALPISAVADDGPNHVNFEGDLSVTFAEDAAGITTVEQNSVWFEGKFGEGDLKATGAGTRFVWYPRRAAIRAGKVSGNHWDDAPGSWTNIGNWSAAFGFDSIARGNYSFAIGNYAQAKGPAAVAFGWHTEAIGEGSLVSGSWTYATGSNAVSFGHSNQSRGPESASLGAYQVVDGSRSVAMGFGNSVGGTSSMATGYFNRASGNEAFAGGGYSEANAARAFAMGDSVIAWATNSSAFGTGTEAETMTSFVVGSYNEQVGGSPDSWLDEDPLFVIGNGRGPDAPLGFSTHSNAILVRKSGDTEINGNLNVAQVIRMSAPAGDISMGQFE